MTREEAWNRIDAIIARHEIDDDYVTITSVLDYDALRMARKALEQEPSGDLISRQAVIDACEQSINILEAVDRIMDLPSVKQEPKTDYKKYINALRKCANEHDKDITPTFKIRVSDLCRDTANLLENIKQESSNDAISREAVKAYKYHRTMYPNFEDYVDLLPSVKQEPKTGHWKPTIVRGSESYICSECLAECCYVTTNYCPDCGARMVKPDEGYANDWIGYSR